MSSWWGKDNARDPGEGRDKGAKRITIIMKEKNKNHSKQNKLEHRVTQPMQRCRVRT